MVGCAAVVARLILLFWFWVAFRILKWRDTGSKRFRVAIKRRGLVLVRRRTRVLFLDRGERLEFCLSFWGIYQILCGAWAFLICRVRRQKTLLVVVVIALQAFFFLQYLLVGLQWIDYLIWFPLGPHEVILVPAFKVAHRPPVPCFQRCPDQYGIIAAPDIVLVGREGGCGKDDVIVVRLIDFGEECSVVPLLQIEIFLLIFGIR